MILSWLGEVELELVLERELEAELWLEPELELELWLEIGFALELELELDLKYSINWVTCFSVLSRFAT